MKYRTDIEDAEDRGITKGRAEGRAEGKAEGENRMARLMQLLLGEKKHDDIRGCLKNRFLAIATI